MILLNIDVTKIPREAIQTNPKWKGKFLKLKLVDHPKDDNDGFIAVDQTKEQRNALEKSAIVGNWRDTNKTKAKPHPTSPADPDPDLDPEDDVPF